MLIATWPSLDLGCSLGFEGTVSCVWRSTRGMQLLLWPDPFIGESKNVEVDGPNGSLEVFLYKLTRRGDFPC